MQSATRLRWARWLAVLSIAVLSGAAWADDEKPATEPPAADTFPEPGSTKAGDLDFRDIEKTIREKLKRAGVDVRMQFIQPGKIFPPGKSWRLGKDWNVVNHEFPDDLTVNIHKEGNKPADVEVKRGDKTWTAKENELGELPEDVREHVEALLGRNAGGRFMIRLADPLGGPHPPGPPPGPYRAEGPGGPPDDHGPGDRPPRGEGPGRGPGRRPPRPDGGPGDHRPPRGEGPPNRPPGPPRGEGFDPDGPGDHPPGPQGRGRRPPRFDGPDRGPEDGPPRPGFGPGDDSRHDRSRGNLERRLDALSSRMQEMGREFEGIRRMLHDQRPDHPRDDEDDSDDGK